MRVALETHNVKVMYIGEDEVSIVKQFENGDCIVKSKTQHRYYFVSGMCVIFSLRSETDINLSLYI